MSRATNIVAVHPLQWLRRQMHFTLPAPHPPMPDLSMSPRDGLGGLLPARVTSQLVWQGASRGAISFLLGPPKIILKLEVNYINYQ